MSKTFTNITVNLSNGAVNNRPIVNGSAVIATGGTNNATVLGSVILNGGTNSSTAAVTGTLTLNSGTNAAAVTGPATISGGTNSGAITGTTTISGGSNSGTITGTTTINGGTNTGAIAGGVTISSGTNSGAITLGPVTISGGTNSAPITAATTISGGTNTGAITGAVTISSGTNSGAITGATTISGGTNSAPITGTTIINGGDNTGDVTGTVTISSGSNTGAITGPATISGGTNSGAITGSTTISGGTNTGAITGPATISGGTNSAPITGTVIVSGGTNTGAVTGSVRVTNGGTQNGTVSGDLYVEAGATISSSTSITGGGKIYAAADVNVTTALAQVPNFTGTVVQTTQSGALTSTAYTAGTAGATAPVTGVFYNLEGGANAGKAYVYDSNGTPTPLNEPKFNLTGDGKAYNWNNGVQGSLFTGTIGSSTYVNGVLYVPNNNTYVEHTVTNGPAEGKLYTASGVSLTTGPVYPTSALVTPYTGIFTYNQTTYYAENGTPNTYRAYTVTGDSNGGTLYSAPVFNAGPTEFIYTNTALTTKYTGVYTYSDTLYYAADGVVNTYREWTVSGVNGGLLYSPPVNSIANGINFYTTNSLQPADAYTGIFYLGTPGVLGYTRVTMELNQNNDWVTVVVAVNHQYSTQGLYHDNTSISDGDFVYTGRYTDELAADTTIWIGTAGSAGYLRVVITSGQAAVSPVNHSNSIVIAENTTYWYDSDPLVTGAIMYTGRYTDSVVSSAEFNIGSAGSPGYATITITAGVVTVSAVDHQYNNGTYYWDADPLISGAEIYLGQYTLNKAANVSFTIGTDGSEGFSNVGTDGNGTASVSPVNHPYGSAYNINVTVWHDKPIPETGDSLYIGQYSNTLISDSVISFYAGTNGVAGYSYIYHTNGIATAVPIDHPYSFNLGDSAFWYDAAPLATGAVLYIGKYSITAHSQTTVYTGTDGYAGYTQIDINSSGVATITPIDHPYTASGTGQVITLYTDCHPTSTNGCVFYMGRYTLATVDSEPFTIGIDGQPGFSTGVTDENGVATVTTVSHNYAVYATNNSANVYYSDCSPLTTGCILYVGQYTNQVAANAPVSYIGTLGQAGFARVTVNGSGVATVTPVDWPYEYVSGSFAGNFELPTTVGSNPNYGQIYLNKYDDTTITTAGSFRIGGLLYSYNSLGTLIDVSYFTGYGGDGTLWAAGQQIPGNFLAPAEYRSTCDTMVNDIKVCVTGLNIGDKAYMVASRTTSTSDAPWVPASIMTGTGANFSDGTTKWLSGPDAANMYTEIVQVYTCSSNYVD